jgi:hypothetical protein
MKPSRILAATLILSVGLSPYLFSSISSGNVFTTTALSLGNPVCGVGGTQIQTCASGPPTGGGITVYSGATALAGTLYFPIGGGSLPSATEMQPGTFAPATATVSNFAVNISAAVGLGSSVVFTWRDFTTLTSEPLTCTISGVSATSCSDMTHSFTAIQGHQIDIQAVSTGTIAGTPVLVMSAQFGTIGQGNINNGSANQTAYYSATGNSLSGGGPGTAGQCWVSNGSGSPPSFQACGGGGGSVSFAQPYATDGINFYGPIFQVVKPLDTAWVNQNGATRTVTNGSVFIQLPSTPGTTDNITCRSMPNTFSRYTITVGAIQTFVTAGAGSAVFTMAGDSGSGKLLLNGRAIFAGNNSTFGSYIAHANSPTTNLISAQNETTVVAYGPVWFRIQDDGTNMFYFMSHDGINFIQLFTESDTAFLPVQPATEVGFCAENLNQIQGIPYGLTVFHMSLTTP